MVYGKPTYIYHRWKCKSTMVRITFAMLTDVGRTELDTDWLTTIT